MSAVRRVSFPDETPSLAEQAYDALEARIVTLVWAPGEMLQERDLVEATGIGRTPVREAVQRLADQGLLKVLPRKGLMVAPLRKSELAQVIEARRVIERMLVVKAAERADADLRAALVLIAGQFARSAGRPERFMQLDRALDVLLARACGNHYLAAALAPLHAHCRRLWFRERESMDLSQAADAHRGMAEAVAGRDGSGAIRALNGIIAVLEAQLGALDEL